MMLALVKRLVSCQESVTVVWLICECRIMTPVHSSTALVIHRHDLYILHIQTSTNRHDVQLHMMNTLIQNIHS